MPPKEIYILSMDSDIRFPPLHAQIAPDIIPQIVSNAEEEMKACTYNSGEMFVTYVGCLLEEAHSTRFIL